MRMLSGAQAIWESLVREGIEVVFGIPGGSVIPLYHALPDFAIHHVLMRLEQAAIHAADAYARLTGKTGVCVTTSGPGATNLVTGLATAYMTSSPVVTITGQAATSVIGTDAFQEVDIASITSPVTKHNYLVTDVHHVPEAIREAFHLATTGQKGPVLLSMAVDVLKNEAPYIFVEQVDLPGYQPVHPQGSFEMPRIEQQTIRMGRRGRATSAGWPSWGSRSARPPERTSSWLQTGCIDPCKPHPLAG